jgi:hypothetical protein
MRLSMLDRLVKRVKPMNALVEKLCECLLPHEAAHASGTEIICLDDWGCGVKTGDAHAWYFYDPHGNLLYGGCGCS